MRRWVQHAVCWLMSAVLLFTGGMPVVIRHAHAVDRDHDLERPHPEDFLALAPAARSGALESRSTARESSGPGILTNSATQLDGLLPVAAHVHLFVFGLEFTFAAGPAQNGGDESNDSAPESSMLARLIEADRLNVHAADGSDLGSVADRAVPPAPLPTGEHHPPRLFISRPLASLPLCDAARHERSGVQLI